MAVIITNSALITGKYCGRSAETERQKNSQKNDLSNSIIKPVNLSLQKITRNRGSFPVGEVVLNFICLVLTFVKHAPWMQARLVKIATTNLIHNDSAGEYK